MILFYFKNHKMKRKEIIYKILTALEQSLRIYKLNTNKELNIHSTEWKETLCKITLNSESQTHILFIEYLLHDGLEIYINSDNEFLKHHYKQIHYLSSVLQRYFKIIKIGKISKL